MRFSHWHEFCAIATKPGQIAKMRRCHAFAYLLNRTNSLIGEDAWVIAGGFDTVTVVAVAVEVGNWRELGISKRFDLMTDVFDRLQQLDAERRELNATTARPASLGVGHRLIERLIERAKLSPRVGVAAAQVNCRVPNRAQPRNCVQHDEAS